MKDRLDEVDLMTAEQNPDLQELIKQSGLTANQLSRLFGVTERRFGSWVHGDSLMSSDDLTRLVRLLQAVNELDADSPEATRLKFLKSDAGKSVFHALLDEIPQYPILEPLPYTPRDYLGLRDDETVE